MATTSLSGHGRTEAFDHIDLLVTLWLLLDVMDDVDRGDLPELTAEWSAAIECSGPGVLDLDLELVSSDLKRLSAFAQLLEKLETRLSDWGGGVPLSHLRARCAISGVWYQADYPVEYIQAVVRSLRVVVLGDHAGLS